MSRKLYGLLAASRADRGAPGRRCSRRSRRRRRPAATSTYKSKTVYDFDDDTVEGDLVRPDGEFVDTRKGAKHSSLIKIRENFIPEMIKSAEDI